MVSSYYLLGNRVLVSGAESRSGVLGHCGGPGITVSGQGIAQNGRGIGKIPGIPPADCLDAGELVIDLIPGFGVHHTGLGQAETPLGSDDGISCIASVDDASLDCISSVNISVPSSTSFEVACIA